MTVKLLKEYLETKGFSYVGDSRFLKDIRNAECLENEMKELVGTLTFTKTYESQHEEGTFVSKIEYYVSRNIVIISAINSIGQKRRMYRASLKDLKLNEEGQFVGFEEYQYKRGLK